MELVCAECQAAIHIPDERVPLNTTFRIACPRCKRKVAVSTKRFEAPADSMCQEAAPVSPSEISTQPSKNADESLAEPLERLASGQPTALLCVDREETRTRIKPILESMGYLVDCPVTTEQALQYLRYNQFHIILLDDAFGGTSSTPVAEYLLALDMNIRRDMFVVLMGVRFQTADDWQAFVHSVDLVFHPTDLRQLATVLTRGLSDHERSYRIFNECLVAAGKKL
jgi:CheY-like chemotaxis protein/DNA-directed RNA polymerase subunit RPC12/RpoP